MNLIKARLMLRCVHTSHLFAPCLTSSPSMMTSSNGNIFRVTGPLCKEFTGHRWIPHTKASDAELWCFLWSAWINAWVNNREAGGLRRHPAHYDVIVMDPHVWHKAVLSTSGITRSGWSDKSGRPSTSGVELRPGAVDKILKRLGSYEIACVQTRFHVMWIEMSFGGWRFQPDCANSVVIFA